MSEDKLHTRPGAEALARRIEAYWAERGYRVTCEIVPGPFNSSIREARFDVRSDMLNGLPKNYRGPRSTPLTAQLGRAA